MVDVGPYRRVIIIIIVSFNLGLTTAINVDVVAANKLRVTPHLALSRLGACRPPSRSFIRTFSCVSQTHSRYFIFKALYSQRNQLVINYLAHFFGWPSASGACQIKTHSQFYIHINVCLQTFVFFFLSFLKNESVYKHGILLSFYSQKCIEFMQDLTVGS